VGTSSDNGKTELVRGIRAIIKTFSATPSKGPVPAGTLPSQPQTVVDIPLDMQPILVHVPKRSISREMAQRSF